MFSFSHIHAGIFEGDIGWRSLKGLLNGVIITCYLFLLLKTKNRKKMNVRPLILGVERESATLCHKNNAIPFLMFKAVWA